LTFITHHRIVFHATRRSLEIHSCSWREKPFQTGRCSALNNCKSSHYKAPGGGVGGGGGGSSHEEQLEVYVEVHYRARLLMWVQGDMD